MNNVVMMGRLTKEPEVRMSNSGKMIARYSLAVPKRFKKEGEKDADFFDCITFGGGAEFAEKYLRKGTKIVIVGELHNNVYTNKDGVEVRREQIVVTQHEFAESKAPQEKQEEKAVNTNDDFMKVPDSIDEELPFV